MKVGDLVRDVDGKRLGFVERIDVDHYGARQAYKVINPERGKAIRSDMVHHAPLPTEKGIRDRVLVCWTDGLPEYREPVELEVVSEGR
jgi:hypothetical protein